MIHPALFSAFWATAMIPFSLLAYRWLYRSLADDFEEMAAWVSVFGAAFACLVYALVGLAWTDYVSAVYHANQHRPEVRL